MGGGKRSIAFWEMSAIADGFAKEHASCEPDPQVPIREEARRKEAALSPETWITGPDTGVSSMTIWSVMTGQPMPDRSCGPNVPHDPDDFGRCYRLLQAFPSWRERLPEVAARYPKWGPMVREWDRMTALYEEELATGAPPKLYDLMHQLEGEGFVAMGCEKPTGWDR